MAAPARVDDRARTAPTSWVVPVACWAAVVLAAIAVGFIFRGDDRDVYDTAFPLRGRFRLRFDLRLLPAVVAGGVGVAGLPVLARRLRWRSLLVVAFAGSVAWAVVLAASRGVDGLIAPLLTKHEYLPLVGEITSLREFLVTYVDRLGGYPTHVKGHPPGMVVVLAVLARTGLGGPGWAAALVVAGGAAAVVGVLVAARDVAGEVTARAAAPFLVLAPTAVWVATSADGFYAGTSVWAVTLLVLATGRRDSTGDVQALAAGLLLGFVLHATYGASVVLAVPAFVVIVRRRVRPLLVAAAGAAAVTAAFLANGFWWFDGLDATEHYYRVGISDRRPYGWFLVANAGAFLLALGPAVAPALARLRSRRAWLLVVGGLAAVGLAALSGFSKGEVERIWLPFAPWLLLATASLASSRRWLAAQGALALAIEAWVMSPW